MVNGNKVYGGIPISRSKDDWNANVALINPRWLTSSENVLHVGSCDDRGSLLGESDDFMIDNVVVFYKTRSRSWFAPWLLRRQPMGRSCNESEHRAARLPPAVGAPQTQHWATAPFKHDNHQHDLHRPAVKTCFHAVVRRDLRSRPGFRGARCLLEVHFDRGRALRG
jgi:hypothetical protein